MYKQSKGIVYRYHVHWMLRPMIKFIWFCGFVMMLASHYIGKFQIEILFIDFFLCFSLQHSQPKIKVKNLFWRNIISVPILFFFFVQCTNAYCSWYIKENIIYRLRFIWAFSQAENLLFDFREKSFQSAWHILTEIESATYSDITFNIYWKWVRKTFPCVPFCCCFYSIYC